MILIKNAWIVDSEKNFKGDVLIEGKIIKKVAKKIEVKTEEIDKIIDGTDTILMPGIVDTHTHIAMTLFRGIADDLPLDKWLKKHIWPREKKFANEEFVEDGTKLGLVELIQGGVTCFLDMYFFEEIIGEIAEEFGIRAVLGEAVADFPTPSAKNYKEAFKIIENQIQKFKNSDLIKVSVGPHAPYSCSKKTLIETKEFAENYNLPIQIHIAETKKEREDITKKTGLPPVKYLESIGFLNENIISAHSVWLDEEEIKIFSKRKVKVAHNPESNMKLASGIAPIPEFIKKGIITGIATDGCASNNNLDMFAEMDFTAKLHKGNKLDPTTVSAKEVFKMATFWGYKIAGFNAGLIKENYLADLILIDLTKPHMNPIYDPYSHIVYVAKSSDVKTVIINGKIIYENYEFKNPKIDVEKILSKTKEWQKRLK